MDVQAYLARVAYDGPTMPSAANLRALHRQHLFTVPFENLDIALGIPIVLDTARLYDKIVTRRRGGFCYELNGLFCALLRELGYEVEMLSARVRREDGGFGQEFDHMLLRVRLEEPWLADVGFGESFLSPLPMRADGGEAVNGYRYWVSRQNGDWELCRKDSNGEAPLYRFHDVSRQLYEYEAMCRYHQTSPESHFTRNHVCTRATPDGRITFSGKRFILTHHGMREERLLGGEDEVRECLREHFGVEFDQKADIAALAA